MILSAIWLVLQVLFVLALVVVGLVCFKHFKAMQKANFYADQGMVKCRSLETFFLGNVKFLAEYAPIKRNAQVNNLTPEKNSLTWLADQHDESRAYGSHDAGKIPNLIFNLGGDINLFVADPEIVQDILVTKNSIVDKTGVFEDVFSDFFGKSFIFSKTDDLWKLKRKATAHAFYKDRLGSMLEVLKDQVSLSVDRWTKKIDASYYKSFEIDMHEEILNIFQKTMLITIFGEDIDNHLTTVEFRQESDDGKLSFKKKTVFLSQAIEESFEQTM